MNRLRAEGLIKEYRNRRVVDNLSLSIEQGEIVGLLGPNGAGKTTTFYMIVGLVPPTEGKVFFGQTEITHEPMYKRARRGISYLPQEASAFRGLTVKENILAILEMQGISRSDQRVRLRELLEEMGLTPLCDSKAQVLSGGERRRLEVARALALSPRFLLLDEPFAGVDPIKVKEIQDIVCSLAERGIGVVISDHNVRETLSITHRSYIIHEGTVLVSGNAETLLNDPSVREHYLGEHFKM